MTDAPPKPKCRRSLMIALAVVAVTTAAVIWKNQARVRIEVWMREARLQSLHAHVSVACPIPGLDRSRFGQFFERRVVIVYIHTEDEARRLMALGPCPMTMIMYVEPPEVAAMLRARFGYSIR